MHPQNGPAVRRAARADVAALLELIREYWAFEDIDGFDADRVGPELERLLGEPRLGAAWIALDGNTPAAYLLAVYVFSLEHLGLTAEIDELFVRPAYRGGGLGARLLGAAEAEFKLRGCTNVSLQVGRENEGGRRFYLQRGYAPRAGFELLDKML